MTYGSRALPSRPSGICLFEVHQSRRKRGEEEGGGGKVTLPQERAQRPIWSSNLELGETEREREEAGLHTTPYLKGRLEATST